MTDISGPPGKAPDQQPLEREPELEEISRLVGATSGSGAACLIEGPAGIGKTILLDELRSMGGDQGPRVLSARGSELERTFSFGLARQLLGKTVAQLEPSERALVLAGAAQLAEPVLESPEIPPASSSAEGVLHGLYWLVANLAEFQPLVLLIDDAHWADQPSVEFIEYLSRRLDGVPVLIALAARSDEPGADIERLRVLASEGSLLQLAPLTLDAVQALAHEALGAAVDDDVCAACHRASGGNPFLLKELLAVLSERIQHGTEIAASEVPAVETEGIAALVAGRLTAIGEPAIPVATALAVLGDGADLGPLATLAGVSVEEAGRTADALVAAMIIAPGRPLAFLHPLLRSAVYGQLGASERARLHARAARELVEAGAAPEAVSGHLLAADAGGDQWVVDILRRVARTDLARGAAQVAVSHLTRALREPPAAELRAEVLDELGSAQVLAGDPDGIEHLREALAASPPGEPAALVARSLAQGMIPFGRLDEAVDVLDAAIAQLPGDARESRLELEAEAASAGRMSRSAYPRTVKRLRKLGDRIAGETAGERLVVANLAAQEMIGGTAAEAAALARRALDGGLLAEQTSASATVYDALVPALISDDFELAERFCEAGLADSQRRGSLRDVSLNLMFRSHLAFRRGRVADAEADSSAALTTALEAGYIFAMTAASFLIDALIERGDLDAATDALKRTGGQEEIPDTWMTDWLLYSRGQLRLAQNRTGEALADLEELGRREEGFLGGNPGVYPYRSTIAICLAHRGDRERALELAAEELELAQAWGSARSVGIALRSLGIVEGQDAGLAHLREAARVLEPSGARSEHARSLIDLGAALRRSGRRAEAREHLSSGMDLAHGCGATVLAERARAELVAAGARPRRLALTGIESLTASERRVARLASEGLANKEIAQALFVTVRTVEMHLGNVYRKLGISSREDLVPELFG